MVFKTPILFIVFNRPDVTERVFAAIKKLQPAELFVVADGPRNEADREKCEQVRAIVKAVDWDCQVKYLLREKNLGVKLAGSSAITWFFEQVEQGIILEDDCLPDQSFFWFCQELLDYYKDNEKIWHISGNNFQKHQVTDSYYFSQIPHIWGWATWRRAWQYYDIGIKNFPDFIKKNKIKKLFKPKIFQRFWIDVFAKNYAGLDNGWDFQWAFAMFDRGGLAIHPRVNLIANIGFGTGASHSFDAESVFANWPTGTMNFPLRHPAAIIIDNQADDLVMRRNLGATWYNFWLKKILKKIGLFDFLKRIYYSIRKIN